MGKTFTPMTLLRLKTCLTSLLLACYVTLAVGNHALHGFLDCGDGCSAQRNSASRCPCGMPHAAGESAHENDEEVFWAIPVVEQRQNSNSHNSPCHDAGQCSICQYHAQGQWTAAASPAIAFLLPAREAPAVPRSRAMARRWVCNLARAPPGWLG